MMSLLFYNIDPYKLTLIGAFFFADNAADNAADWLFELLNQTNLAINCNGRCVKVLFPAN